VGAEPSVIWHLGPWALRGTPILWTWIAMAVVIGLFALASIGANVRKPTKAQNFLEYIYDFIGSFLNERFEEEKKRREVFFLLIALFLFILVSNILGLIPFAHSATNDANTTLGLALIVFAVVHAQGVRYRGGVGHVSSFFKPYAVLVLFTLLETFTSPLTLGLRLFGNIFAGEVLLLVIGFLVPWLGTIPFMGLEVFIGGIQAFIFAMLTLVFIVTAVTPHTGGEH